MKRDNNAAVAAARRKIVNATRIPPRPKRRPVPRGSWIQRLWERLEDNERVKGAKRDLTESRDLSALRELTEPSELREI